MENTLTVGKRDMLSLISEKHIEDLIKPLNQEILLFDSYVAGTTHIEDESIIDDIKEGDELILLREPENVFDENAILVLDVKQRKIGYIPEKDNVVFARLMDAGKYLKAKVDYQNVFRARKKIYISIYLVDF